MPKFRLLIIDDAVVIRRLLTACFEADPDIEVVGTAADGQIGLAKIEQLNPDIVTLDMEMPVMNGLQTLEAIRRTHPGLPVIMFSTLTEGGALATLDGLARGASDYFTKPANLGNLDAAIQHVREELRPKIRALCSRPEPTPPPAPAVVRPPSALPRPAASPAPGVLAIGVSTGGPNALATLLPALTRDFPLPIVIVQHMPPLFTRMLAERIEGVSGLKSREGTPGALLRAGEAWIAPGGLHMEVEGDAAEARLALHAGPPENSCRPAVDVLFRSVARTFGPASLAVVLTGMGHDGLKGCRHIRAAGGRVLVQDEASSVVWGMPGAVARAGLAERILPLDGLALALNRLAGTRLPACSR